MADFFLSEEFTPVRLAKTSLDFIKEVKSVQGVSDPGIVREIFKCLQDLLLRFHDYSPVPGRILALTPSASQPASLPLIVRASRPLFATPAWM